MARIVMGSNPILRPIFIMFVKGREYFAVTSSFYRDKYGESDYSFVFIKKLKLSNVSLDTNYYSTLDEIIMSKFKYDYLQSLNYDKLKELCLKERNNYKFEYGIDVVKYEYRGNYVEFELDEGRDLLAFPISFVYTNENDALRCKKLVSIINEIIEDRFSTYCYLEQYFI